MVEALGTATLVVFVFMPYFNVVFCLEDTCIQLVVLVGSPLLPDMEFSKGISAM